ncbi:MAG: tyrosine-type recombinase/integrase [Burkholderiales bacterium]|nr:tyrosine-type recombinase/integrase [Burkholderiales bacterium]
MRFDEASRFSETEWAVFRTYALVSTLSMADVASRHNITPQKAGRVFRAVLAELIRRAERHGATGDVAILQKNPRRSGRTASRWSEIAWKYRQHPAPNLSLDQHPRCWFERRSADRLDAAGYSSLRLIVESLNKSGVHWYSKARELSGGVWVRAVPRFGATHARQIASWLVARQSALGVSIEPYAVQTWTPDAGERWRRAALHSDVLNSAPVPLERLRAHPTLSGITGRNRASLSQCRIDAFDDLAAIRAWLSQHPEGGHTWRAYRREIERFLAWAIVERKKAFSALGVDDCTAYRDWLLDPQPASRWLGSTKPRWHPDWRPFQRPLSPRSAFQACGIVRAGMDWLVRVGYLAMNPWALVNLRPLRVVAADGRTIDTSRAFSVEQLAMMRELLDRWEILAAGDEVLRLARQRFIVLFGMFTGVRLAELAALRFGDLSRRGDQYWLAVLGKGRLRRDVPLPVTAVEELSRYLDIRGMPAFPENCPPDNPLIAAIPRSWQEVDPMQCLSTSRLARIVKEMFQRVGDSLNGNDRIRFKQASTHWMRHTYGSRLAEAGASVSIIQKNLGHANLQTTTVYLHNEDSERWGWVQKL